MGKKKDQLLKDMKDILAVILTLSQGLLDEVMLGLQLGDQVPAFQKLLQLLQYKDTHDEVTVCADYPFQPTQMNINDQSHC